MLDSCLKRENAILFTEKLRYRNGHYLTPGLNKRSGVGVPDKQWFGWKRKRDKPF